MQTGCFITDGTLLAVVLPDSQIEVDGQDIRAFIFNNTNKYNITFGEVGHFLSFIATNIMDVSELKERQVSQDQGRSWPYTRQILQKAKMTILAYFIAAG